MKIKIFIIIWALLGLQDSFGSNETILSEWKDCVPSVKLDKCGRYQINKRYTYHVYNQLVDITFSCGSSGQVAKILWSLRNSDTGKSINLSKFNNKVIATIGTDQLEPGDYVISVEVKEKGGNSAAARCNLVYVCEPPVLIFTPAPNQYIQSGDSYTIDLSSSINYGTKPLNPKWKVECVYKELDLCKDLSPCLITANGMQHTATLGACQKQVSFMVEVVHDGEVIEAVADIFVIEINAVTAKIECKKNCDRSGSALSNPNLPIYLELTCVKHCIDFEKLSPTWDVSESGESVDEKKYEIINEHYLNIPKNVFVHGDFVLVDAMYPEKFRAPFYIEMTPEFINPTCDIQPRSGISLVTVFTVTCTATDPHFKKYPFFYQVYQTQQGNPSRNPLIKGMLIAESSLNEIEMIVGALGGKTNQNLVVRGYDTFYNNLKADLPTIQVQKTNLVQNTIDDIMKRIDKLYTQGNGPRAVQLSQAFMLEVRSNRMKRKAQDLIFMKMMKSMAKLTISNIYMYNQMATMVPFFYERKNTTLEFRRRLSELCQNLANLKLSSLLKSKYAKLAEETAKNFSELVNWYVYVFVIIICFPYRVLGKCADKVLDKPTEDVLPEINVTPPSDVVPDAAIKEDYPNYDVIMVNSNVEKMKPSAIDTILKASQAIASTLTRGEKHNNKENNFDTNLIVEDGKTLSEMAIEIPGAVVKPKIEVEDYGKIISGIVTSYKRELLQSSTDEIKTNIVDVGFFDADKSVTDRMENLQFNITFDILEKLNEFVEYTVTVPSSKKEWKLPRIDYMINVHRINLMRASKCSVLFKNLNANEKLQVIFTKNRRPKIQDFDGFVNVVIPNDPHSQRINCPFEIDYNWSSFVYLAILPHEDKLNDLGTISTKYSLQMSTQTCMKFDMTTFMWVSAGCNHFYDYDKAKITCSCNHTSLFAANLANIVNKLDKVQLVDFETVTFVSYVIFLHVAGVFLCFCIAISFQSLRKQVVIGKSKLFFLSDNLKNDRYAYLLLVETGTLSQSGTSSNIVVQLYGAKMDSKPHVLNYPDPEKRVLQRGNVDWFVMTNSQHLGNILGIRLWFDSIGIRPAWYCDNITVLDLQDKKLWTFKIDKWLSVEKDKNTVEFEAKPNISEYTYEDVLLSLRKSTRFYVDGQHTWNIFSKNNDDKLSYPQRITLILSMIYTTYAITVWCLRPPTFQMSDAYGYGPFRLCKEIFLYGIGTSLASSVINLPFAYFFRNSQKERNKNLLMWEMRRYRYTVTNITWAVLISWISMCLTYLLVFGFWVTIETSWVWSASTVFSLMMSIFVVENVFLIIYTVLSKKFATVPKKYYNFSLILKEINSQRRTLFKNFGEVLFRPYFYRHYKILDPERVDNLRAFERRRMEIAEQFKDFCVFVVDLILVFVISLSTCDDMMYVSNRNIKKMVIDGLYSDGAISLDSIDSIEDIYNYINTTIIEAIHPSNWYKGYNIIDGGLMIDFNTKILGVVQLRQQRRNQSCTVPFEILSLKIPCSNDAEIFDKWEYSNGSRTSRALGQLDIYNGEGYVITLGRTLFNSYYVLSLLRRNKWIDINTKVLFIEFWTYNVNQNLFNAVRVIIERDPSGHLLKSYTVQTLRLFYTNEITEYFIGVLLILLIVVIGLKMIKKAVFLLHNKLGGFLSFGNILDLIILLLSVVIVVMYFIKNVMIDDVLDKFANSDHNEFVYYFDIINLLNINLYLSGLLMCLATLRLWKYLRFSVTFLMMEESITKSAEVLVYAAICHLMILATFALHLYLLFGSYLWMFKSLTHSLTSICLISLNMLTKIDYHLMYSYYSGSYIVQTMFLVFTIFMYSIYVTILIGNYEDSKNYHSHRNQIYTIKDFVLEEATYLKGLVKRAETGIRLRSGGIEDFTSRDLVYPKDDAHRYADCVLVTDKKLTIMRLAAVCIIKNKRRQLFVRRTITENYYRVMAKFIYLLMSPVEARSKFETTIFYKQKDQNDPDNYCFISDTRLLQMEYVTKRLLGGDPSVLGEEVDFCSIHITGDEKRLQTFKDTIDIIVRTLENILIVEKKSSVLKEH